LRDHARDARGAVWATGAALLAVLAVGFGGGVSWPTTKTCTRCWWLFFGAAMPCYAIVVRRPAMSHHSQQGRCGLVNFSAHSPQTCRPVSAHGTGQHADLQRSGPHPSQRQCQRCYGPLPFRHRGGAHTVP